MATAFSQEEYETDSRQRLQGAGFSKTQTNALAYEFSYMKTRFDRIEQRLGGVEDVVAGMRADVNRRLEAIEKALTGEGDHSGQGYGGGQA